MDGLQKPMIEFIGRDVARFTAPMIRLVAEGQPVELERLAAEAGVPVDEIESWLRAQPGTDWDERGRLLGFGLTQRPTRHRYIVDGRVLYTFCAADTLIFTPILGRPARVESSCPTTSQTIRIELTPGAVTLVDPATSVVSALNLCCGVSDIRARCAITAISSPRIVQPNRGAVRTLTGMFARSASSSTSRWVSAASWAGRHEHAPKLIRVG